MDSKSHIRVHQRVLNVREKEIEQNFSGNFSLMVAPEDVNWAMSKEKCTCDIDDGEKEYHCLHQCDCSINRRTCGARCPCYGNCQYNSFLSLPQTEVRTNLLGKKVVVASEDIEFGRISCVITGNLVSVQDDLKRESRRQLGAIKYSITAKWRGRDRNLPGLPGIPTFVIDTQASPAGVLRVTFTYVYELQAQIALKSPPEHSFSRAFPSTITITITLPPIVDGIGTCSALRWVYGNEDDEYADICLCGENECRGIAARPGSSVMQRSIQHYNDVIKELDQLANLLPGCFGVPALSPPRSPKGKLMPSSYKEELEVASTHALPSDSDEEYQMKHVPNLRELLKSFEARELRDDLGFQDPLVGTILRYILKWSEEAGPRGRSNPELEEALGWYEEKLLPRGRLGLLDPIVGHVLRDLLNWYKFRRYPAHATKTGTTTTNSQKAASSLKSLDSDSEEWGGRPQSNDAQSTFSSQSSRSLHSMAVHYPNNRPSSSPSSLYSPSLPSRRRQTQSPRAKAKVSWGKNIVNQSPARKSRARTPERPRSALGRKGVWEMWKRWMGQPSATTVEGILGGREVERSNKNGKKSGERKETATFIPFSPTKGKSRRSSKQSLSEGGSPRGALSSSPERRMLSPMSRPGPKDFDIPIQPAAATTAADATHESKEAEDSSVEWDRVDWGHGLLKPQEITDACMFDAGVVKIRGIGPWPGTMRWFYWLHKTFRHPTTVELADFGKTWIGLRITTLQGGTEPQKLTLNSRPTEREVRGVMKRILKLVPSRISRRKSVEDANRGNMYPLVWADMNKLENYLSKIESSRGTHF